MGDGRGNESVSIRLGVALADAESASHTAVPSASRTPLEAASGIYVSPDPAGRMSFVPVPWRYFSGEKNTHHRQYRSGQSPFPLPFLSLFELLENVEHQGATAVPSHRIGLLSKG
ncbi:hypothetical protein H107_04682 [Trichophyton rubrum CBS 202.88]|nr:hypothetical protein H110_04548 [Trichophyton rubrum MR1448]EZG16512.1 hypothetical protein H107_04682 [Trichophyton rubrum CBS 202.88]